MKNKILVSLLVILVSFTTPAFAFQGKIVKVTDGDTVQVLDSQNRITKVRLYGIDCPENSQAFEQKAKEFVLDIAAGKTVDVDVIDIDKYQRSVGVVKFDDKILNEEILKAGFGWFYDQYCKESFCKNWQQLEQTARINKAGLWSDVHAQAPWEYRHGGNTAASGDYHGNIDSLKFHKPDCRYYNSKNCTRIFKSKEEAEKAGYSPCKICKP